MHVGSLESTREAHGAPRARRGGGGGVLPYMGYIGMCGPKG